MTLTLNDKAIRQALIARLEGMSQSPRAIIEELRIHNGNAIADVVAVHAQAHCYEIKGDTDSINRISRQSRFYDLAFKRLTLVTTTRQLSSALRVTPPYWGIIVSFLRKNRVGFKHIRAAATNPYFDKQIALMTLWRSELMDMALSISDEKLAKYSRLELSKLIAPNFSADTLGKTIGDKLFSRAFQIEKSLNI